MKSLTLTFNFAFLKRVRLPIKNESKRVKKNLLSLQVKVVTGKDGQAVTPVAIATQLPANVSAAFSVQQFQVKETKHLTSC